MSLPYPSYTKAIISLIILIPLALTTDPSHTVYFDRYGDCWREKSYYVEDEAYTVHAIGSGQIFQIVSCQLRFKTDFDHKLCLTFKSLNIRDCSVSLRVYGEKDSTGNALAIFDCSSSASTVCSKTRYLTLVLHKKVLESIDYDFEMEVVKETVNREIIVSLSVLIAVIFGVAAFIAIFAAILVFCWQKNNKHHGKVKNRKGSRSAQSGSAGIPLQPSAPPIHDLDHSTVNDPYSHTDDRRLGEIQNYPMEPPPPYEAPLPQSV